MSGDVVVHVRIDGHVQGVGYRAWTDATARDLGLTGWVRNRQDGSVEAVLPVPGSQVARMLALCRDGPRAAQVSAVEVLEEGAGTPPPSFEVRPTQ